MTVDLEAIAEIEDRPLKSFTARAFPLVPPWKAPLVVVGFLLACPLHNIQKVLAYMSLFGADNLRTRVRFIVDGETLVDEDLYTLTPFYGVYPLRRPIGFDEQTDARFEFEDARLAELIPVMLLCFEDSPPSQEGSK